MKRFALLLLLCLGPLVLQAGFTRSAYVQAITDENKSPLFVLVKIPDGQGGSRSSCIESTLLISAIRKEYALGYDKQGAVQTRAIAVKSYAKLLDFKDPEARESLQPSYTVADLKNVQSQTKKLSKAHLFAALRTGGALHDLYSGVDGRHAYKHALAHVLLSRGIKVRRDQLSGNLLLVK